MEAVIRVMKKLAGILILTFAIIICNVKLPFAEIYGYQDREGYWHFPDEEVYNQGGRASQGVVEDRYFRFASYMPVIRAAAIKYGVEEALVKAIVMAESDFQWTAISKKGAVGLMQLMPETAKWLKVRNPFCPKENIEGGVRYLKDLLSRFNKDIVLAVAAYNAGPNRVEAYGGVPPINETRQFVWRVLYYYHQFK